MYTTRIKILFSHGENYSLAIVLFFNVPNVYFFLSVPTYTYTTTINKIKDLYSSPWIGHCTTVVDVKFKMLI